MADINYQFEIFKYESEEETQFNELRTIEKEDGNILFCASDVAKMLGYENPAEAVANHCKSGNIEKCYVAHSNGSGGVNMKFIPEGDVYRLIIRYKLPSAERFESWIFDEVIPSIRKKGYYGNIDRKEEPNFLTRFKDNDNRTPITYFSVVSQLYLILNRLFEYHGYVIPNKGIDNKEIRPDNAVGRRFIAYLEDKYPELLEKKRDYKHKFPNGYEFPANMYPNEMLPIFIEFVYGTWLPTHASSYLGKRDPLSLEYLPKVLSEVKETLKLEGKDISEFSNNIESKSKKKEKIIVSVPNDDFDKGIDKILGFEED